MLAGELSSMYQDLVLAAIAPRIKPHRREFATAMQGRRPPATDVDYFQESD